MSSVLELVQQLQSQLDASQLPLASLTADTFDLEAFLKQCLASKGGSSQVMKTLENELSSYLQASQAQVDSLIHQDFESLLKVPKGLKDFDARVNALQTKLNAVLTAVNLSLARLEGNKEAAVQMTENLKQLTEQERNLEAKIYILESKEKVENLLQETPCSAILERVSRLAAGCIEKLRHCPDLQPDVNSLTTQVKSVLEATLTSAWRSKDQRQIHCLLRCFGFLGQGNRALELVREAVVTPVIREALEASLNLKPRPDSPISLSVFFQKISQEMVSGRLQALISASHSNDSFLLSQGLWREIQDALSTQRSLFTPTYPLEFKLNFNEAISFVNNLREIMNPQEQGKFTIDGSLKPFVEKWNLPAYFVTRQNEVIKTLQPKLAISGDIKRLFLEAEKPSTVFIRALEVLWSGDYYVPYLLPRFLRMHFQVLSRYVMLISKSNSKDGVNVSVLKELLVDVQTLNRYLQTTFESTMTSLKVPMLTEVVSESVGIISQISHPTTSSYIQLVVQQCSENLLALRSIPTIYKMTGRPRPVSPSTFVDSFLRPLLEANKVITDSSMLKHMAETIAQNFSKVLSEVIEAISKYEQMFSKLKDTGESSQADGEKMRLQLRLDAGSFLEDLKQWGVTEELTAVHTIQQLISS